MEQDKPDLPDPVKTVIHETIPRLTENKSLDDLNNDLLKDHAHSLEHVVSGKDWSLMPAGNHCRVPSLITGAQVLYRLHPAQRQQAVQMMTEFSKGFKSVSLKVIKGVCPTRYYYGHVPGSCATSY